MKLKTHRCIALLACALAPHLAMAGETADDIMTKVDLAVRKSFTTQLAAVKITTCKYTMDSGSVKCSEKPRVVVAENAKKKEVLDGVYNYQQLSIVREPISDKGSSLLVYEYGARGKDNDNWLYLPALGKVNRIIANDEEGGSVFGSEFSVEATENPEARKVYEYTYKLLDEVSYEGHPAYMVEITPGAERSKKTAYSKVVTWIDKVSYLPLKEDLYRNGKLHKQRTQTNIRKIDGVFIAGKSVMNNLSTSRISQMDRMAMRHNTEIPDEFLSQRSLTDFSFRERNLAKFRVELSKASVDDYAKK
jgi:hypothetical protein